MGFHGNRRGVGLFGQLIAGGKKEIQRVWAGRAALRPKAGRRVQ
jgi:hypothetical protein